MFRLLKHKPNAHPSRLVFKHHDIPLTNVAKALKLNYSYVCAMLSGTRTVPKHVDRQLKELMQQVETTYGKAGQNQSSQ